MLAVVFLLTAAVLVLVQARVRSHVREDLVSTLRAESHVYAEIEQARREQAQQSAALIASQPSLKALMSTNDRLTVEDGSQSLLRPSRADLVIRENPSGDVLAFHSRIRPPIRCSAPRLNPAPVPSDALWDEWHMAGKCLRKQL